MSAPAARPAVPVRTVRNPEWRVAGEVLGRAFQDDPVWRWLVRDDRRMQRHLGALFAQIIRGRVRAGTSWTTPGLSGVAVWAEPKRWRATTRDAVGILPAAVRTFGAAGVGRSLGALHRMETGHPAEPHWYLEVLGTDPTMQGCGVGGSVMAPVLQRCDTEGVPAFLESSKEENLPFYGRHGFEVIEEFHVGEDSPPLWRMWREPR